MRRKSADRSAADAAIAALENAPTQHDASRNMPLPPEVANALSIIAKRNGRTLKSAIADLAGLISFQDLLRALSDRYRADADAELSRLFNGEPEA